MRPKKSKVLFLDDFENAFANNPKINALKIRADLDFNTRPLRGEELTKALSDATGVVLMRDRTPFGAKELAAAQSLRFVIYTGTRNNLLDSNACEAKGIPIFNTEFGPSKASTCELTWGLILAALKRLEPSFNVMREPLSDWRANLHYPNLSDVLEGETIGLIGLGNIGSRVSKVAQAFGMTVLAWSPNMTAERARSVGASFASLEHILAKAKVISLHLVLGPTTRNLIDEAAMKSMRRDSVIVNTSRSGLINQKDLIKALQKGRPAMAALDVFDEEPLPADHPFRSMPNVVMTPHMGFVANPVYLKFTDTVAQHLDQLLPQE
jgi:phosphoglycerate dehydrogenase-like enzyme